MKKFISLVLVTVFGFSLVFAQASIEDKSKSLINNIIDIANKEVSKLENLDLPEIPETKVDLGDVTLSKTVRLYNGLTAIYDVETESYLYLSIKDGRVELMDEDDWVLLKGDLTNAAWIKNNDGEYLKLTIFANGTFNNFYLVELMKMTEDGPVKVMWNKRQVYVLP